MSSKREVVTLSQGQRVMDGWAIGKLIDWAAGSKDNAETRALMLKEIRQLADELAGATPKPIQHTLAEPTATCWFAYRSKEARYASAISVDGMTFKQSMYDQPHMERVLRRSVRSVKTLAEVRRVASPAVLIKVPREQVCQRNVGDRAGSVKRQVGAAKLEGGQSIPARPEVTWNTLPTADAKTCIVPQK